MRGCNVSKTSTARSFFCKTGTGHIEMLIGFVILMGAIILTFTFIQDINYNNEEFYILNKVLVAFSEEVTSELISFHVVLNESPNDCINLSLENHSLVKGFNSSVSENGGISYLSGEDLYVNTTLGSFRIYFGNWSNGSNPFNCNNPHTNFSLGPMKFDGHYSFDKIKLFEEEYYFDYENLKSRIGIGILSDFSIESLDGSINMNKTTPKNSEIYSLEQSRPIIFSNGTVGIITVRFKVW